jgi:hypothetical protein
MSGEYEDTGIRAIFKSKTLADHYAKEQAKTYYGMEEPFWVMEYELQDDNISLNYKAKKYYFAYAVQTEYNSFAFTVDTDGAWDSFLSDLVIEGKDRFNPKFYGEILKSIKLDVDKEEREYGLPIEYKIDDRDLIIEENGIEVNTVMYVEDAPVCITVTNDNYEGGPIHPELKTICVYSSEGYHKARQVAVERMNAYLNRRQYTKDWRV